MAFIGLARGNVSGSIPFSFLMLACAVYALGTIFEIRGASADELHFWLSVEYLGIAFLGPLWLLVALSVSGRRSAALSALVAGLLCFSVIILAMVWTNGHHRLFYASIGLARRGSFAVSVLEKGPLYWAHFAFMNGCVFAADCILFGRAVKAPAPYRGQAALMFAASLVPWASLFVYLSGASLYGLDIAPLGLALSGAIFAWGLFRHRLFDLGLIAYERIFEGMREGILVLDRKERVVGMNPAMARILRRAGPDSAGKRARDLLVGNADLAALIDRGPPAAADVSMPAEGGERQYEASLSAIPGRGGKPLGSIVSLNDITLRVALAERLEALATVDGLTGVANRRAFLESADRELRRARRLGTPVSALILDLDEFKKVNDTFGHAAGDAVLKAAAGACARRLRSTDLFCRYGGEEFAVLLPGLGPREAAAAAERLRSAIASLGVDSPGGTLRATASFGCTGRFRLGEETMDELLREADEALYKAKAAGRDRVEAYGPAASGTDA